VVETISKVNFGEIDGAIAGIGIDEVVQNAVQGMAKLHGFDDSKSKGFLLMPMKV